MRIGVVVGNPKPQSRTLEAARQIVQQLTGHPADVEIDVAGLGADVLAHDSDPVVAAIERIRSCDVLVVASPTYKGAYTGLLKLLLDHMPGGALDGIVVFPLMMGAAPHHSMAPEVFLKPVLVELGAVCPVKAMYVLDSEYTDADKIQKISTSARVYLQRHATE